MGLYEDVNKNRKEALVDVNKLIFKLRDMVLYSYRFIEISRNVVARNPVDGRILVLKQRDNNLDITKFQHPNIHNLSLEQINSGKFCIENLFLYGTDFNRNAVPIFEEIAKICDEMREKDEYMYLIGERKRLPISPEGEIVSDPFFNSIYDFLYEDIDKEVLTKEEIVEKRTFNLKMSLMGNFNGKKVNMYHAYKILVRNPVDDKYIVLKGDPKDKIDVNEFEMYNGDALPYIILDAEKDFSANIFNNKVSTLEIFKELANLRKYVGLSEEDYL